MTATVLSGLLLSLVPQESRPSYVLLSQEEDWSRVDEAESPDWADPLKHIPLDEAGDWRLTLGGRARFRVEGWNAFGFDAAAPARTDDVFWLSQILAHADLTHASGWRLFTQLKSADVWDRELPGGSRPLDEDPLDLQQAFLERELALGDRGALGARVGRQMLYYGRGRLVGPAFWSNTLRSFDTVMLRHEAAGWRTDVLMAQFVPVDQDQFNDTGDDGLYGVYANHTSGRRQLDLYWLGSERDDVTFNGTSGDERRHTLGFRHGTKPVAGETDHDLELALQVGEVGQGDVLAWMLGGHLAQSLDAEPVRRVALGLEVGSGDRDPGGDVETFHPMYPLGHRWFGWIDAIGRSNIVDLYLLTQFALPGELSLDLFLHGFWRTDVEDAVYNPGGVPYLATLTNQQREVGSEIDLVLKGRLDRHWTWNLGYSHFVPAEALELAGLDVDSDLFYATLELAF